MMSASIELSTFYQIADSIQRSIQGDTNSEVDQDDSMTRITKNSAPAGAKVNNDNNDEQMGQRQNRSFSGFNVGSATQPAQLIVTGGGGRQTSGVVDVVNQPAPIPHPNVPELSSDTGIESNIHNMSVKEKSQPPRAQTPPDAPPSYESVIIQPDYTSPPPSDMPSAQPIPGCAICQHDCLGCQMECLCPTCKQQSAMLQQECNHSCDLNSLSDSNGSVTPPPTILGTDRKRSCGSSCKSHHRSSPPQSPPTAENQNSTSPTPAPPTTYTLKLLESSSLKSPTVSALLNNLTTTINTYRAGRINKHPVKVAKKILMNHLYAEDVSRQQIRGRCVSGKVMKEIWKGVKVLEDEIDTIIDSARDDRKEEKKDRREERKEERKERRDSRREMREDRRNQRRDRLNERLGRVVV